MAEGGSLVKPLGVDDLCVVQEELYVARTRWYNLGLKLGLKPDVLDTIETQCSENPDKCFRETLKDYLKTVTPSWRALVEALRSPIVNQPQLAEKVENKYCSAWQPETKDTPQNYGESLINMMGSAMALSSPAPEVMSETEKELPSFAMQTSTSSALSTDEQHLPEDYGCGCGECSFDSLFEKGCPKPIPSMSSFSHLNTDGLDNSQKQILRGRLYREFEVIITDFGSLVYKTCGSLIKQGITVRELVRLLMALDAFQPTLCERPLLEECIEELQAADNIDKVFLMLRGYMSFFSYHIVEYIIDAFGTQQDKENLRDYTAKLNEYSRRSIFECPTYSLARKDQANLVVKLEGVNLERYNLIHLAAFKSRISNIIKVTKYTLRLCTVEKGCLQLTFQMPHFVKEVIFPLADSQTAALKVEGVARYHLEEVVELVGTPNFTQPFPAVTPMCEEHDRPQDLFCKTCDELLCGNCLVESHANHIFSEAKDVMQEELDQLKCNHLEVAEEALLNMMTGETEVTVVIDEMKDRGEAVRKHIREYFRLIRDSLYQREEYLLTTADCIIKKKVDALQQQTDTLERCRRDLQGQIKMLNHMLLLRKDDVQFLIDKKRIMAEVESAVETARTKERTPTENTKDGPDYYLPMSLLEGTLNYTEVFCKPCPVRFTAFGENLTKAFVGVEASFTIQARDQYGLRSYKDGSTIDITIKDPNSVDVECHISLPEQLLGEYVVHYTPKMLGVHNIVITADGQAITDSKSTVVVLQNRSRDYLLLDRPSCVIMKHQVHPEVSTMRGVCAVPNNNIMFVDAFCLRIIAQDGTLVNTVGSYGNGPGQFTLPLGVAANKHGVIFVSDSANHRVEKFSPEGNFLLSFGNQDTMNGCLDSPEGIALLAEEKVYVADRGNNRIQVFMQRNGKFAMGFGKKGNGPVQFNGPRALTVDAAWNRLLVTDCGNSRIQAVTLDGKPLMQFGTQGSVSLSNHFFPFCITTDRDGFVFVTETRSRSVLIFTPQGYLIKRLGEDLGLFRTPHGISVDTQGQVIVTDASSHRMYFFKLPSL